MSSYSSMTDNPLVEAVALAGMREEYRNCGLDAAIAPIAYSRHIRIATAALRAIEDAGYRIEKVGIPNLKG